MPFCRCFVKCEKHTINSITDYRKREGDVIPKYEKNVIDPRIFSYYCLK